MGRELREYRRKRDFSKTTEPAGSEYGAAGNRFVIHKHSARADHYDLRLQVGEVLKCWAVPKGPSLNPAHKRLAVQTEDHPVEYADFEGVIPKGQYGAGPMIVWDAGVWVPVGDIETNLKSGQFKFRLQGEKLGGGFMLARLKRKPEDRNDNWLLFKEKDRFADEDKDILETRPESVKSGRTIDDLQPAPKSLKKGLPRPRSVKGAVKSDFPDRIAPQLATSRDMPPDGDGWLHEIKFDGYRTLVHFNAGAVQLVTRNGLDWTRRYGNLGRSFAALPCKQAVIDGEIVVLDERGISQFSQLQQALSEGNTGILVFFAFDLLYLDGWDLRGVALSKRKECLERLLAGMTGERSAIQYSDHVEAESEQFFRQVSQMGLEGVVSKRISSKYQSGRTKSWTKSKAIRSGEFVITGYTTSGAVGGLAALALGETVDGEIRYVGKVGTGFNTRIAKDLLNRLQALTDGASRIDKLPKAVTAVKPLLSAIINYTGRTASGALRHPVYRDLRQTTLYETAQVERKRLISDAELANIWVTNPERRLFGSAGPTKLDIAVYYASVGDFMLPHLLGRPVSLIRCPTGRLEDCFYQRHAFTGMPPTIATFTISNSEDEQKSYIAIEDAAAFLALAQFGVVEFHAWGSTRKRVEKPDRIIFDLDPGEGLHWREIVEAGLHVREELLRRGLVPFVKTSGGKGLHVVVPIKPKHDWKQVHEFTGRIAEEIASKEPGTFITTMSKKKRKGRIFIDFHRNARTATAVAAYSLRAGPHLTVSTPLSWSELETIDGPADLNYSSLPKVLMETGDPWLDIGKSARPLTGSR